MRLAIACALGLVLALASGCASNPYDKSTEKERASFKKVSLPLPRGTHFVISQGAFGRNSHDETGNGYNWDFDVPFGTDVVAVEDGEVYGIWAPPLGGACDFRLSDAAHNIRILHADGTVAQYVHVDADVRVGNHVRRGQKIGHTGLSGWICTPQLHFGIYNSVNELYEAGITGRRTIPVLFRGLPDGGMARQGYEGVVP